ncbi:MAG TPA: VWA domain-containing protein [Thermoanaerobaculia bacterium]|nr:VWA domain-containing protein [Thermoanaerobaculia bacterium]
MTKRLGLLVLLFLATGAAGLAQDAPEPAPPFALVVEGLGDSGEQIVIRVVFTIDPGFALPGDREIVLQGTVLHGAAVVRNFRRPLRPEERARIEMVQLVPRGEITVEGRLMAMTEGAPLILAKATRTVTMEPTGIDYVAPEDAEADAIFAEGVIPEGAGKVRIKAPRRDLAPNLFQVEVEVEPPVRRVEFWIDGRKIMTRNAPPYQAELDLGSIPQRVEVRAVGYDARGRYVDADAWIVNERENELEVKVTRTETPDGISHFKVTVQNPKKVAISEIALFANDERLVEWKAPPYALDLPTARLAGKDFVRATIVAGGTEVTDLLYLDGDRYIERVDVNLVELPVTVLDATGTPIVGLGRDEFEVLENGKTQVIESFGFASNLPLSLGVLVDHSGSMKPRIVQARQAAVEFFSTILKENDKAFFGGFAFSARGITPFVATIASLRHEIADLPDAEGATALYDAIVSGLYRFRGTDGRKALIIVTDGEDTASRVVYDDMLRYVRAARVPIYFIGIGLSRLDFGLNSRLRSLAAETGGVAYFIGNVDELRPTYEQLEKELRSQYLLGYYTESTKGDRDYRTVEVRVKRPDAKIRTIRGFIP